MLFTNQFLIYNVNVITVTNIYDNAKTITLSEIEGVALNDSIFYDVEPGGTRQTTATRTVYVPKSLTTKTTFDAFASTLSLTITAE